ncbi:MAG TPA: extracellular solute-binding protein [Alphaproteobacteria bacterium]|jgi:ABC-type Fe3+ transport system substrate-binding protein
MPSLKGQRLPLLRVFAQAAAIAVIAVPAFYAGTAASEELPKSTQAFLTQLKLSPDIMKGLDAELAVPQAWIDGAKTLPVVKVSGIEEAPLQAQMIKPFLERYPFMKVDFQRGSANERVVRPLLAFGEGRYLVDVAQSMNGSMGEFIRLNAAEDLSDLPTFKSVLPAAIAANGRAVGFRARAHCMSYNTNLIQKDQLPKTWAELPNSEALRGGHVGAVMLPQLWLTPLRGKYGEAWAVKYLDDFFVKLKPQIRREGMNAAMNLVAAGENVVSLPAYGERIKELQDKGAPIAFYCPDLVPLEMPKLAIFRGTPALFAAKLYVNWLLSKEGQIAQLAVYNGQSVHKDIQSAEFFPFPAEVLGKEVISFDDQPTIDKFVEIWNKYAITASPK